MYILAGIGIFYFTYGLIINGGQLKKGYCGNSQDTI